MDAGPSQLLHRDPLPHRLADHPGTGQEHPRRLAHHDEVGERGRVGASSGGDARDDGDLGNPRGELDARPEDPPVTGQRVVALLQASAAGLDEADDGNAGASGELEQPADRLGVDAAERAAHEARVLRIAGDRTAGDLAEARDHAVARRTLAAAALPRQHRAADRPNRAGVAEALEPGDGARRGDDLAPGRGADHAARHRTALCPPKPNEFEIAVRRPPSPFAESSGRASSGT